MPSCRTGATATQPEALPPTASPVPVAQSGPIHEPTLETAAVEQARAGFERQADELRLRLDNYEEALTRARAGQPGRCWAAEEAYCAAARQKRLGLVLEARRLSAEPRLPGDQADSAALSTRLERLTEEAAALTADVSRRRDAWHETAQAEDGREPFWLYALVACGWLVTAVLCARSFLP